VPVLSGPGLPVPWLPVEFPVPLVAGFGEVPPRDQELVVDIGAAETAEPMSTTGAAAGALAGALAGVAAGWVRARV
jgi:hypothetical protein